MLVGLLVATGPGPSNCQDLWMKIF
jgi:hypothetical protein